MAVPKWPQPGAPLISHTQGRGAAHGPGHDKGVALVGAVELLPGAPELVGVVRRVQRLDCQRAQQRLRRNP